MFKKVKYGDGSFSVDGPGQITLAQINDLGEESEAYADLFAAAEDMKSSIEGSIQILEPLIFSEDDKDQMKDIAPEDIPKIKNMIDLVISQLEESLPKKGEGDG